MNTSSVHHISAVVRRYRRSDDVNKPRIHIQADMERLERNLQAIHLISPERWA